MDWSFVIRVWQSENDGWCWSLRSTGGPTLSGQEYENDQEARYDALIAAKDRLAAVQEETYVEEETEEEDYDS